jgi:uncharacterized protein
MRGLTLGLVTLLAPQQIQVPPPPRGFGTASAEIVVDSAHILSQGTIDRVNRIAFDVHEKSGGEMALVTLPDLGGRDVAQVALQIGRQWGVGANAAIGNRARNAGVVILVVPKETSSDSRGHIRIETGRGSEGFLTDAQTGDIQREAIPYFQRQDYDGALLLIARRVAERFASEFQFSLDTVVLPPQARSRIPRSPGARGIPPGAVLLVFVVIFVLLTSAAGRRRGGRTGCNGCLTLMLASQLSGRRRRSYWGGGGGGFGGGSFGGGGGFGGFGGGGGFSGGGSSGSW